MKYLDNYKIFETLNSRGSKSLTQEEFYSILEKNCKVWMNHTKSRLYRSQRNMGEFVYTDARGTYRSSIEDVNIHLDLIDNLDCWKSYPKYGQAIIGISDNAHINYGSDTSQSIIYEIIPFDNIKIAVCPEDNIWSSFSKYRSFGEYIWGVDYFLNSIDIDSTWMEPSGRTLKDRLKSIGNVINYCQMNNHEVDDPFLHKVSDLLNIEEKDITGEDVFRCIEDYMFNPTERGFRVYDYNEKFYIEENKQIWCNGPVLLLDKRIADALFKEKKESHS